MILLLDFGASVQSVWCSLILFADYISLFPSGDLLLLPFVIGIS